MIDKYDREGLRIGIDTSLPASRVIRASDELVKVRGPPLSIRLDIGPEFIALALAEWAQSKSIALNHIQPGKSTQNACVERFNRTVRYEWLSQNYWADLQEVQMLATQWMWKYNHDRPNMVLGGINPK